MDNCVLGYTVKYFNRGGQPIASESNILDIHWQRKLDDDSICEINYIISEDNCCSELGQLEPIAHEIGIYENGTMVWYGWILNIEYSRNGVFLDAFDALGWLKRRKIHNDITWVNTDESDIFLDLWNDAMNPSPVRARVLTTPTGIKESREVKKDTNKATWSSVKEMLDTGLDVTTFGQTILAGIIHTVKPLEIRLSDIEGDATVVKQGSQYANSITVDASESIRATYPDTPPSANDFYPLVEEVIYDPQIQDQQTAENTAKSRYEYSRRVPRIVKTGDSLVLQQNLDIDVNDLIPGIKVIMDTEGLCYATKQEFRLGQVDVNIAAGVKKISISLQPVGARGDLNSAEDPIL